MTGLSALAACAVAWYIPARRRADARHAGQAHQRYPEASPRPARATRSSSAEAFCSSRTDPVHPAVITVMKTDGTPVDWSRADSNGDYSVVLPGPGRYLVLANAQGWTPRAEVLEFLDANTRQHITLTDQLTLSGTVSRGGAPIGGALVTLSEAAGEVVGSVRADDAGRYCMPLPAAGRYIVTMLEPDDTACLRPQGRARRALRGRRHRGARICGAAVNHLQPSLLGWVHPDQSKTERQLPCPPGPRQTPNPRRGSAPSIHSRFSTGGCANRPEGDRAHSLDCENGARRLVRCTAGGVRESRRRCGLGASGPHRRARDGGARRDDQAATGRSAGRGQPHPGPEAAHVPRSPFQRHQRTRPRIATACCTSNP